MTRVACSRGAALWSEKVGATIVASGATMESVPVERSTVSRGDTRATGASPSLSRTAST